MKITLYRNIFIYLIYKIISLANSSLSSRLLDGGNYLMLCVDTGLWGFDVGR
jgi:hypothetical protein